MKTDPGDLAHLQNWLQKAVTTPWEVGAGEIEGALKNNGPLTPAERMGIYIRAYQGRLVECMENEFPVLSLALGRELFVRFASDFLIGSPSRSYTLHLLGRDFPKYMAASGPDEPWARFIIELAFFERAFSEVFHADGHESSTDLPALETELIIGEACSRLIHCEFPIDRYFTDARNHLSAPETVAAPELPDPEPNSIVIFRRDYIVRMRRVV